MTDDEYYQFCTSNPGLRIERAVDGNILIIPPAGFESGHRNHELNRQLRNWALEDGWGRAFDSSVGSRTAPNSVGCSIPVIVPLTFIVWAASL
jgi:Uma2 family endonuclease